MSWTTDLTPRQLRYVQGAIFAVGGFALGFLLANDRSIAGAGIGGACMLAGFAIPYLYAGPVEDERTRAIEEWASRTTLRIVGGLYLLALVGASVLHGLGRLEVTGGLLLVGIAFWALFVFYLFVLAYATHVRHRAEWLP